MKCSKCPLIKKSKPALLIIDGIKRNPYTGIPIVGEKGKEVDRLNKYLAY